MQLNENRYAVGGAEIPASHERLGNRTPVAETFIQVTFGQLSGYRPQWESIKCTLKIRIHKNSIYINTFDIRTTYSNLNTK